MWWEMLRIIGEVRPSYTFIENSPMLVTRGLERVLCDLASLGFDAKWGIMGAADLGGQHRRDRIWILASNSEKIRCISSKNENAKLQTPREFDARFWGEQHRRILEQSVSEEALSEIKRDVDAMDRWTHRLAAIGNGQVPVVAATAWRILSGEGLTYE
jgi:DNA (cytosine-5)-methyltransferase 1